MRERICLSLAAVFLLAAIAGEIWLSWHPQPKPKPPATVTMPDNGDIWIGGEPQYRPEDDKDWRGI